MKALRGWLGLLLACIAMLAWLPAAQARPVPVPAMSSRVVDLTNTLQASEADDLRQQIDALETDTEAQLAVLIVPTTGEDSIEQFATRVFAQWKLGREDADDGVLLLVALKDRRMRIEVGTGLEGRITDIQAARIIDQQMTPRFRSGDFAGGIRTAVQSLSLLVGGTLYGTEAPQVQDAQGVQEVQSSTDDAPREAGGVTPAGWALFGVLLWSIAVGAWHGRRRAKPAPTAEDWLAQRTPAEETYASGKRKKRRKNAERSRPPSPVASPASAPFKRWPFSMALLAAAPLVAATVLVSPALLGMLLFLPAPVGFGLGIACSRSVLARIVTTIAVLLIVALTFAGKFMDGADIGLGMMYMVIAAIVLAYLAAVGLGARNAWRESPRSFWVRLVFVLGATAILGWTFYDGGGDDIGLPMLLVAAVSSAFAFLPKAFNLESDGSGSDSDSDSGWSSSSSSSSSSDSSSSSSSSSSDSGGSSSGGGASGSW